MLSLTRRRHDDGEVGHFTSNRLLAALMDSIECGILACDQYGTLYHANIAARRELALAGFLRLVGDRVHASATSQDAWSSALFAATTRRRGSLIVIDDAGDRLMVAIMPVGIDGTDKPAIVAMLGRRAVCSPLALEMLCGSHGLTHAERRVLRELLGNRSAREIAASHGVAMATIRTQIQAVRDKLGVRSIGALLLRAAAVPPVMSRF